jgi:hypothetical protein
LAGLDDVVDALQIAVSRKPGNKDAIKQELEKIDDLIRSAMRGLNALRKIPDAGMSHHVPIGGGSLVQIMQLIFPQRRTPSWHSF